MPRVEEARAQRCPRSGVMAARENLLGEDVQLFLSSRCHCSQWLLQLGTGGVNWVWCRPCWGCSPFVPSTELAFVLGNQLTPVKRPLLTPFCPKNYTLSSAAWSRRLLAWDGVGLGGMGWGIVGKQVKGSF